jgi:hypothetical protein
MKIEELRTFLECVLITGMIIGFIVAISNPEETGKFVGKVINGYESARTDQVR